MRPLEGLRVVDLTRVLSGPYCTMQLGDLGAEVIKVEQPGKGDDTRAFAPPYQGDQAAYFLSVNRNKKSITLDMKSDRGQGGAVAPDRHVRHPGREFPARRHGSSGLRLRGGEEAPAVDDLRLHLRLRRQPARRRTGPATT